ncbi:FAD-dependent monooxygenase [Stieleria sp. JC731]|uniref:NAD(P)/FAD-dependent oxidoreductase n=1 Tax=Pirellulaceae TaxID=2691357 RepID=UPI001E45C080|nr:FAD-dependent monooxygenase [Stieleria sp. JC731]MCC9603707.1 FAD-dependent monooxygenase [Stieleria sp. JC731]
MQSPKPTQRTIDDCWDCVVVGGGPAGAIAARESAKHGLKTLLVERHPLGRNKVCGACLNHHALLTLKQADLLDPLKALGGTNLHSLWMKGYGRELNHAIPTGLAISRSQLDRFLVQEAVSSGAVALSSVSASIESRSVQKGMRQLELRYGTESFLDTIEGGQVLRAEQQSILPTTVYTKSIVLADGLGRPSLKTDEFHDRVAPDSYIGLGTTIPTTAHTGWMKPNAIHMAASDIGYVGLVMLDDNTVNLAAAVSSNAMRDSGSPEKLVDQILGLAGFPKIETTGLQWRGTRPLSRRVNRVSGDRIFLIGDASGYVEPFTGEGMAWGMHAGMLVAEAVRSCADGNFAQGNCEAAARLWQSRWKQRIYRSQNNCRRLTWMLRHPKAAKIGVAVASRFPALTSRLIHQANTESLV